MAVVSRESLRDSDDLGAFACVFLACETMEGRSDGWDALLPLLFSTRNTPAEWTEGEAEFAARVSDPMRFGTPFPLPTVQRSHPAYDPASYWRGAQWGRSNWFALRCLSAVGAHDAIRGVMRRQLDLLGQGGVDVRETFDPETGGKHRCRMFTEGLGCFIDQLFTHHVGLRFHTGDISLDRRAAAHPDVRFVFGPFRYRGRTYRVTNDDLTSA